MDKLRKLATDIKFWIGFTAVMAVSIGAVWTSDLRPLLKSEGNDIIQLVAANEMQIIQIQIDQITRQIWQQEDRNANAPTQDGKDRLRELKEQRDRLEERKRKEK